MMGWLQRTVAEVLHKVLGQYILGIDKESFRLSVWSGQIRLQNLRLNEDGLALLLSNLPFRVVGGHLGLVSIDVPWRALAGSKISVTIDRVYVVLGTHDDSIASKVDLNAEKERARVARQSRLDAWEALQIKVSKGKSGGGLSPMLRGLLRSLFRRLSVSITNVHVRICDNDFHSELQVGISLPSLVVGDSSNGASVPASAKGTVCKGISVQGFSVNVGQLGQLPSVGTPALDALHTLDGNHWQKLMEPPPVSHFDVAYVVQPLDLNVASTINMEAMGAPTGKQGSTGGDDQHKWRGRTLVDATVDIANPLALALSHTQLLAIITLSEHLARAARRHALRGAERPVYRPTLNPHAACAWWAYAARAVRWTPSLRLDWSDLKLRRRVRFDYIAAYQSWLAVPKKAAAEALTLYEERMMLEDILRYRSLAREAHAQGVTTAQNAVSDGNNTELELELQRLYNDLLEPADAGPALSEVGSSGAALLQVKVRLERASVKLPSVALLSISRLRVSAAVLPSGFSIEASLAQLLCYELTSPIVVGATSVCDASGHSAISSERSAAQIALGSVGALNSKPTGQASGNSQPLLIKTAQSDLSESDSQSALGQSRSRLGPQRNHRLSLLGAAVGAAASNLMGGALLRRAQVRSGGLDGGTIMVATLTLMSGMLQ